MLGTAFVGVLAVNALSVKPGLLPGVPDRSVSNMLNAVNPSGNHVKSTRVRTLGKLPAASVAALKTPSEAGDDFNVITVAPEGETVTMSAHSITSYIDWDMVSEEEWDGLAYDGVRTASGEFYLYNPISKVETNSYIKGTVTGTGLIFEFPQPIYRSENQNGSTTDLYVDVLEPTEVEDPEQGLITTYVPAKSTRTITFTKNENGQYVMDGDLMLGLTCNDMWQGYGEMHMVFTPFDSKPVLLPSGLKFDYSYILADELNGMDQAIYRPLGIAHDGEDTYISGLFPGLPDSIVKGAFDSVNNTLTIPSDQFMGRYINYYIFMMAGDGYEYYDEDWEEDMIDLSVVNDPIVLYFNPEKHVFTPSNEESHYTYMIFNFGNTGTSPCDYLCIDRIFSQGEVTDFTPVNPSIETVEDISADDPTCSYGIEFYIYGDNNEGQMLMDKNIYYNVYINDVLYPLTVEEFPLMKNFTDKGSIVDVPASYSDDYDIFAAGTYHGIAFRNKNIKKIGIQALYIDGEIRAASDIVSWTIDGSSVDNLDASSPVVAEEYFDVNGCRIESTSSNTIVIKRVIRENGTVNTYKIVR